MAERIDSASLGLGEAEEVPRLLRQHPEIEAWAYREGEYLIREDEESQDIFIVLQGALVVEQAPAAPGGAPAILACVLAEPAEPAIVGEMAYLGAQRRAASVRSSGRSLALRLQPAHIDGVLEGYPGLTRVICRQFSRRMQDTDRALHALQARFALDPRRRLAEPGEPLFAQGDPAAELIQLVAGAVRLECAGTVRVVTPEDLPDGFLEPEAYLRAGVHACAATVAEPAFLAVIAPAGREAVVRCYPDLALRLLAE